MLPKLVAAAVIVMLSAGLARAQMTDALPGYGGPDDFQYPGWSMLPGSGRRTPEQLRRDAEIERKYRETVNSKIPDKKASNDPWRKIRPSPASSVADRHRAE